MTKVLIVDDEMLVRVGIKSLIDWEQHGFTVCGDAADGQEALKLIEREPPDIILTDIIMPNLNGLELIKRVKEQYPRITIIVLSCHNDYDYVRQAMKLGAADYLLKLSMKPQELLALLKEDRAQAGAVTPFLQELGGAEDGADGLCQCLEGLSRAEAMLAPEHLALLQEYVLLIIKINGFDQLSEDRSIAEKALINLLRQQGRESFSGVIWRYRENELAYIIDISSWNPDKLFSELTEGGNDLVTAAKRFLNLSITIGASARQKGVANLKEGYRQASTAQQIGFYEGLGRLYHYQSDYFQEFAVETLLSKELTKTIVNSLELGDDQKLLAALELAFEKISQCRPTLELTNQIFLDLTHSYQSAFKEYGAELEKLLNYTEPLYKTVLYFEELSRAREWFIGFSRQCCQQILTLRQELYREEIQRLLDYLKTNYAEDLSLKWAADYTNMSETYLSRVFKAETKKNFVQYLTGLRMEKAAELLRHTDWPSYLIAEKVGYDNFNYFGRLFKKLFGVSPSEYRKM